MYQMSLKLYVFNAVALMIDLVFYLVDIDLYECPTEKRLIEGDHAADGLRPFLGL